MLIHLIIIIKNHCQLANMSVALQMAKMGTQLQFQKLYPIIYFINNRRINTQFICCVSLFLCACVCVYKYPSTHTKPDMAIKWCVLISFNKANFAACFGVFLVHLQLQSPNLTSIQFNILYRFSNHRNSRSTTQRQLFVAISTIAGYWIKLK